MTHTATPAYQEKVRNAFSIGRSCQDEIIDSDTQKITLEQMKGFFVIFSILVGLALVVAGVRAAQTAVIKNRKKDEDHDSVRQQDSTREGLTDAEMIIKLLDKVDAVMRVVSVNSQSAATELNQEKDIEKNLVEDVPAKLMQQMQTLVQTLEVERQAETTKLQALEAERQVEAMKVRALEAEKQAEVLKRDLDAMRLITAEAAKFQPSAHDEIGRTVLPGASGQIVEAEAREILGNPIILPACAPVSDVPMERDEIQKPGFVVSDSSTLLGQLAQVVNSIANRTSSHEMNPNTISISVSMITLLEEIATSHNDVLRARQQLQHAQETNAFAERSAEESKRGFQTSLLEWRMREQDILSQLADAKQKLEFIKSPS